MMALTKKTIPALQQQQQQKKKEKNIKYTSDALYHNIS